MEILFFVYYGTIAGLLYLLCAFARGCFGYNKILTMVLDLFWGASAVLIFGICLISKFSGIFKPYQIIGFVLGLIITKISLGNLVASIGLFVYNKIIIKIKIKAKILLRRAFYGSKKINKTSENCN